MLMDDYFTKRDCQRLKQENEKLVRALAKKQEEGRNEEFANRVNKILVPILTGILSAMTTILILQSFI